MRVLPWVTIVTLVLGSLPAADAQAGDAGREVWTDGTDDVEVDPPLLSGSDYPNADLVSLHVREVPSGFWFRVTMQDLASSFEDAQRSYIRVEVPFDLRGEAFQLDVRQNAGTILYYSAVLRHASGDLWLTDTWNDDTIVVHPAESWISVFVPRDVITFAGPTPGPADALSIGQVTSVARQTFTPNGEVSIVAADAMPDEPTRTPLAVRHGAINEGQSWMSTPTAFRSSNGGAGGMLYNLTVHNDAGVDQSYVLRATSADRQVAVTVPSRSIDVPAGGAEQVPVYVEVPFGHQHGGFVAAMVEARSTSSDDIARLQVGVEYLAIPQPAGHHDRLFFHDRQKMAQSSGAALEDALGGSSRTRGFMNAQEDDVLDTGRSIPPYSSGNLRNLPDPAGGDPPTSYRWVIELDPRLDIGLDFRTTDRGTYHGAFESVVPMSGDLSGRLVWIGPRAAGGDPALFAEEDATVLGRLPGAELDLTAPTQVELDLALTQASDRVLYVEGSDLLLELFFNTTAPRVDSGDYAPQIQPGGYLDVPLNEYRDPVQDVFASAVTMSLDAIDRRANPGDVLVADVRLAASVAASVDVSASSEDLIVEIPGTTHIELERGAGVTVPVIVRIPGDAPIRDDVPVFFLAESDEGTAAAILLVDVVEDPVDDDAERAASLAGGGERASPGLGLFVTLLAALVAGGRVRRLL